MEFKNEYKSTRGGFSHTSHLYDGDRLVSIGKCNYLNRTWEVYTFQSSMKKAVAIAIEQEIQKQRQLQGIKRLTKEKRQEIVDYSSIINQLKNIKL
jgi:hypothetical protein